MSRIAYVHNYFIPSRAASTFHITKMCQALVQEGYPTTLFAYQSDLPVASIPHHYGLRASFDVVLMRPFRPLRGHDVAFRVARRIKRAGFLLVFSRALVSALWTARLGIPTIYETHLPPGKRLGQYYLGWLLRQHTFKKLVVIGDILKAIHLERYPGLLSPEQIIIEPDAVDLERFAELPTPTEARHHLGLPEQFTVGYAGNMYRGRGIELLMELAERLPDVQFLLAGEHHNHSGPSNARFLCFVPNAELPTVLAACEILLMPYQQQVEVQGTAISTHAWMSPMKMFEYMAAERLIISSDLPSLRQVLNEQNAVLCDPTAAEQWEATIQRAQDNPTWAAQLARQARQDVQAYTWRGRVRRIMASISA